MNLNHIHLHVMSVSRAADFYKRYFGMRELVWHGDMVFLRDTAGMDLALAPTDRHENLPDWFHIGFRLESCNEVRNLHERMLSDGVAMRAPLAVNGDYTTFKCADPDDYTLEIYYEPDPA